MRKTIFFSLTILAVFTSCSKMGTLSADHFRVTPTPLETMGSDVPATISVTFPAKYMKKNVLLTATPILKSQNGEVASMSATFQGEKVQGNATAVPYKYSSTHTLKASFPYTPDYQQSDLMIRFEVQKGKKTTILPDVKIGYGVIATSDLLQQTVRTANPALAPDAYQRVIKQKQEAQIKYLVNQANIRASELNTTSIKDFINILKEIRNNQDTRQLTGVEISAYASPEGSYDFNERLAERRQQSSSDYVSQQLKRNKVSADIDTRYTAEDWEGFQQLVSQSTIQDKDVILRVLSMYKDPAEREQQIRNMSIVYDELAKAVLPELRRARLIANYEVIGRSDDQIQQQHDADMRQLSIEEMLHGAAFQQDATQKRVWYEQTTQLFPEDARAFNNLALIAYQNGDLQAAANYLAKAKTLSPTSAEVATNEALIALAEGRTTDAETLLARGTGANSYNEVLGNLNIAKGNYAAAAASLSGVATNSAALAQILNKDYAAAATTLAAIANPDATTAYLRAILAARQGDKAASANFLQQATQQDPSLAKRAERDLEFKK